MRLGATAYGRQAAKVTEEMIKMSEQEDIKVPPKARRDLEELNRMYEERERSYQELVESIQSLPPLEKAEAWLKYVVDHEMDYGDQEALVYLVSRGYDCAERIMALVSDWKLAAERAIEDCMRERRAVDFETGEPGRVVRKGISYAEASDVRSQSPYRLPDFWSGLDHQELSIDATMLRTVEWCSIGGFNAWWLRLARENYELVTHGGIEAVPASFFLFNMCRSDYGIQIMNRSLIRILEAAGLSEYKQSHPWRRLKFSADAVRPVDHFAYAASLAFANERLRPGGVNVVPVDQALEALLESQDKDGSWRCWADEAESSVDTTGMAIHALAIRRPRGWELAASAARDWLWSTQDRSGSWHDPGCPDSVYLTVLVLDALELAGGGSRVSFSLARGAEDGVGKSSPEEELESVDRIRALYLAASPADTPRLSLDEQIRSITEKIRAAEYRESLDLVSVWAVRADDLIQSLNEHKPHVVHFSGHGSEAGEVLVVGIDGRSMPISTTAIRKLFTTFRDNIRVVILDACYSESQAEAISEVIDCVIGMEGTIGERAATIFFGSFYRAIGFGRSVQEAFDQGIVALLLEGIPEETTPKLLARQGVDPRKVLLLSKGSQ